MSPSSTLSVGIAVDPYAERLFTARTIVISGGIDQEVAERVITQLIAMTTDSSAPINVYINSQGGHVEAGDTIHDMIGYVDAPVNIIGTGWVASAGALIYVSVPRERRYCLPNTRFLLHQPAGGAGGTASDIAIEAREIVKMRERLNLLMSKATGQTVERIEEDTNRNFWLEADAAIAYGLAGKIIRSPKEIG